MPRPGASLSSFVGRTSELDTLEALLREARLLTLAGPGGIGKTRLALALVERMEPEFEGRLWFVELGDTTEPRLVVPSIAAAVGVTDQAERGLLDGVLERLGASPGLLVLDTASIWSRRAPRWLHAC